MDIISHYSAYTPVRTSAAGQAGTKTPGAGSVSGGEFLDMVKEQGNIDAGSKLYNGATTRAKLSDTEIAVLVNKYDVRNMSDDEYDSFLNDLESMGAVSAYEKRQLGCGGWLSIKEQEDFENLHKALAGIVGRMAVRQADDAEEARKAELVRQLADKNSEFYTNMRTTLKAQVEKTNEDEEEQAIIDALGAVLDALSGKKDVSGHKESVNKSATDLTRKIGDRIARLKREDPDNPEIVKLENMLKRLQEMGIYIDLSGMDDWWQDEDETFETLTQLLIRRQAEEISKTHPTEKEVNEPA